ncbi:MAG: Na+/H+ antiporter NhaC family protein, partial [Rikenellaceae bacterium]|nr:Na+/H+ antiporter NhaC family protein [Rikenellaceae bacterium]
PGWMALSPLMGFLLLYLVLALLAGDFYAVPISVAFLFAAVFAVAVFTGLPLKGRLAVFSSGAADQNVLLMIWIFILAGAFTRSAAAMGAIEATVNLTLRVIPDSLLIAGIFLASCFISLSVGTSVGTVVALTPVAAGIAAQTGAGLPFMVAVVVGGALFGDNLSFISDTTIAATRTQGVAMKDKFRVNSLIVIPVAVLMLAAYILLGTGLQVPPELPPIEWIKVIPYLLVLVLAMIGIDVTVVLLIGILSTGLVGFFDREFGFFDWFGALGQGITGMGELIIVTLLAAGLLELIRAQGGIDYIITRLTRKVTGKRGAELSIAALVSIANVCTANNTIAIITVGGIAKNISDRFGLDARKTASLLDTFSCFVQGILPYGAQLLMAAGLAGISPVSVVPYLYYPMAVGLFSVLAIILRYPRTYS